MSPSEINKPPKIFEFRPLLEDVQTCEHLLLRLLSVGDAGLFAYCGKDLQGGSDELVVIQSGVLTTDALVEIKIVNLKSEETQHKKRDKRVEKENTTHNW